jgi:hypothetical protein
MAEEGFEGEKEVEKDDDEEEEDEENKAGTTVQVR